ncbi:MAG: hypothetical protein HC822_16410 [Oscillochloris sp.]|nr:hypothetical protein [Oscillochloris sp.]
MTEQHDEAVLQRLIALVSAIELGTLDEATLRARIANDNELRELIKRKQATGESIKHGAAMIDFGSNQQTGDIRIRDVIGGDLIQLTINITPQQPQAGDMTLDNSEIAHKRSLIAQHRRMLQQLELQAAKFGIYAPPHITLEIADLKRTIAELRREIGE